MTAAKKIWNADEFATAFLGQNVELAGGQIQALPPAKTKHGRIQTKLAAGLVKRFDRAKPKPTLPGGWWLVVESPVKSGSFHLFCHDLAGWLRERVPADPSDQYPVTVRPDWVCEILSTNIRDNKVKKHKVLHEWQVPYFWLVDPDNQEIRVLEWDTDDYKICMDIGCGYVGRIPPFDALELSVKVLFGVEYDDD